MTYAHVCLNDLDRILDFETVCKARTCCFFMLQVQSVPTVFGVKDGKVMNSFIGLKEDDEIKSFVDGLL